MKKLRNDLSIMTKKSSTTEFSIFWLFECSQSANFVLKSKDYFNKIIEKFKNQVNI